MNNVEKTNEKPKGRFELGDRVKFARYHPKLAMRKIKFVGQTGKIEMVIRYGKDKQKFKYWVRFFGFPRPFNTLEILEKNLDAGVDERPDTL